jgi:uncharacterized RDD family membrane protein YckC
VVKSTTESNPSGLSNNERRHTNLKRRFIALGIDLFLYTIVFYLVIGIIDFVDHELRKARNSPDNQISGFIVFAIALAILWLYHAIMESSRFQATLGKILMGIKLSSSKNSLVTFSQATIRFAVKFGFPTLLIVFIALIHLPFLTAIVALLMLWLIRLAGANPRKQGFHDVAAGTIVLDK